MRRHETHLRVLRQFVERRRGAVLIEVLRRGAQHRRHAADGRRDEPRIGQLRRCQPQRDIDVFFEQIGHARRQQQVGLNLGVLFQKPRERRDHEHLSEARGRVQAQGAAGGRARSARLGFRDLDERHDVAATSEIALSRVSERELACRAMQQAGAQMRFEFGDGLRRLRRRHVECARRPGKACRVGHPHEDPHVL